MTLFEAIICGIVQGATEFLPVSSSGHLALMHGIFGMSSPEESVVFDIMLHLATLLCVITVYYKDIFALVPAFFKMTGKLFTGKAKYFTPTERFALAIVIATLPLAVGIFAADTAEKVMGNIRLVGAILIFNGFMLLLGDRIGKRIKKAGELSGGNSLVIGLFQLAAIFPGLSRSGATITGGMFCGLTREDAVKFSFILSIPAIIGANVAGLGGIAGAPVEKSELVFYIVGMIFAALTGFAALKLIRYLSKKRKFGIFAYYCFVLGAGALIFG